MSIFKKRITVDIHIRQAELLEAAAKRYGLSRSELIRRLIEDFIVEDLKEGSP